MNSYLHRTHSAATWLVVFASILALSTQTALADDQGIFGYWKRVDEDTGKTLSVIRLWEDKGKLVGKIVKVFFKQGGGQRQEICSECTGAQHNQRIDGLLFMWGFARDGSDTKWIDGKVLNPENGKAYNGELTLSEDGKTLSMYGYLRILVKVGGTTKWQRATPEDIQAANTVRIEH